MRHTEFYSVMAQVIPVLILTIVFEMRALERATTTRGRFSAALLIYVLAIGEALALAGTYFGTNPVAARVWISFSAGLAGMYLIGNLIDLSLPDLRKARRGVWPGVTIGLIVLGALPFYVVGKIFNF